MPDAGMPSLFDYAGYPVGMVIPSGECGYDGVIDWTGLPCGALGGVPPVVPVVVVRTPLMGRAVVKKRNRRDDDIAAAIIATGGFDR